MTAEKQTTANRAQLKKSTSRLAEAFVILSGDVGLVKDTLDQVQKELNKLHKAITGDPEFQAKGIIDHGKENEARISRVEERAIKSLEEMEARAIERHKALTIRIETLEGSYKWICGAAFALSIVVGAIWSWLKDHLFK